MSTTTKEHSEIFSLYTSLRSSGGTGILATVVRTSGSTYRRAGARMLVSADGRSAGLISGGCLENDLRERSAGVLAAGEPLLVTYDSTSPDDILWGLGLGCTGVASVLLERISPAQGCKALEFIEECRRLRRAGAIGFPYLMPGAPRTTAESTVFIREGSPRTEEPADDVLRRQLTRACETALSEGHSSQLLVALPGGKAEALVEYISAPVSLFVFGAGPDASPLVHLAKEMGWYVTVVDRRPAYLARGSFPGADELVLYHPDEARGAFTVPPGGVAVIMTHNFENDVALVRTLLGSNASYIGLLGPRAKADLLMDRLAGDGMMPTDEERLRFHAPVGLDIGAETPEEIALAIIAEIQATLHGRPGTPLRFRDGPIHR